MADKPPLYCTLYNAKIGNFSGFKVHVAEAHHYLIDPHQPYTAISRQMAIRLQATATELQSGTMNLEIVLNSDPISFEAKLDKGEIPAIPQWALLPVTIKPSAEMRIFDLIIGNDAVFKPKATAELWAKHIKDYQENKKMSFDIF